VQLLVAQDMISLEILVSHNKHQTDDEAAVDDQQLKILVQMEIYLLASMMANAPLR
jgi:hypothetical protein